MGQNKPCSFRNDYLVWYCLFPEGDAVLLFVSSSLQEPVPPSGEWWTQSAFLCAQVTVSQLISSEHSRPTFHRWGWRRREAGSSEHSSASGSRPSQFTYSHMTRPDLWSSPRGQVTKDDRPRWMSGSTRPVNFHPERRLFVRWQRHVCSSSASVICTYNLLLCPNVCCKYQTQSQRDKSWSEFLHVKLVYFVLQALVS